MSEPFWESDWVEPSVSSVAVAFTETILDPETSLPLTRMGGSEEEMTNACAAPMTWHTWHGNHWYSRQTVLNADDSLMMGFPRNHYAALWRVSDRALIGWAPVAARYSYSARTLWDKNEANVYWSMKTNDLIRHEITSLAPLTVTQEIYRTFAGYDDVSFGWGEGDFSTDGSKLALGAKPVGVTNEVVFIAYRVDTDQIVATTNFSDTWFEAGLVFVDMNWCSVDPSGDYIAYGTKGDAAGQYVLPWDLSEEPLKLTGSLRHSDLIVDEQGESWLVRTHWSSILAYPLAGGQVRNVFYFDQTGDGHISSIAGMPGKFSYSRYQDGGIYLLDVNSPRRAYCLGNSRHDGDENGIPARYAAYPRASMSASGRFLVYASDNLDSNTVAQSYMVELPETNSLEFVEPMNPTSVFLCVLDFNEGSGSTAADSTGNGNDGVIDGAQWSTNGFSDDALVFDGSNDYVDCGAASNLALGRYSFSVSAWVKQDDDTGNQTIVSRYGWGYQHGGGLAYLRLAVDDGIPKFTLRDDSGAYQNVEPHFYDATVWSTGDWHHVMGVRDMEAGKMRLYVDDYLIREIDMTKTHTMANWGNAPFLVGAKYKYAESGCEMHFDGLIDEVNLSRHSVPAPPKATGTLYSFF